MARKPYVVTLSGPVGDTWDEMVEQLSRLCKVYGLNCSYTSDDGFDPVPVLIWSTRPIQDVSDEHASPTPMRSRRRRRRTTVLLPN